MKVPYIEPYVESTYAPNTPEWFGLALPCSPDNSPYHAEACAGVLETQAQHSDQHDQDGYNRGETRSVDKVASKLHDDSLSVRINVVLQVD